MILPGERFEQRHRPLDVAGFTTGEHRQRPPLGSLGASGNGGIDHSDTLRRQTRSQLGGDRRGYGRAIDHQRPRGDPVCHAAWPEQHLLEIRGVRNTGQDRIGIASGGRRRFAASRAQLGQWQLALAGAVVDGHRVAGFDQVPRHRRTHRPHPDHPDSHAGMLPG